jgi:hypothetical protein
MDASDPQVIGDEAEFDRTQLRELGLPLDDPDGFGDE